MSSGNALRARPSGVAKMDPSAVSLDSNTRAEKFVVPNLTINDILRVIPAHCFERNGWHSSIYFLQDILFIGGILWLAHTYIPYINADHIKLPHPTLYSVAQWTAWMLYGFAAGVAGFGLFVVGHECGHGAYATSRLACDVVGYIVHSFIGVPYFSWKITHHTHHANTSHLQKDLPFVPYTRSEWSLPALDAERENLEGTYVDPALQEALAELLEYSPVVAALNLAGQLFIGWWVYLVADVKSQRTHPSWTNHFQPSSVIFKPHQAPQVILSTIGVGIWAAAIAWSINVWGFVNVFKIYLVPYIWTVHWLVFVTYLQHTDPSLPHYDAAAFTFARGALSTLDRHLMGGPGLIDKVWHFFFMHLTHSVCETHIVHHLSSRIPHYNAWEAKAHVDQLLKENGIRGEGNPATWSEAYRIVRECKFIEEEGPVRFYKNARGLAARVPVFQPLDVSDSGIDL